MKTRMIIFPVITFLMVSCNEKELKKGVSHSEIAPIHKRLYEINHNLMIHLMEKNPTQTDSAFFNLCKYIDVVVIELINSSGGLDANNGGVANPEDQRLWIKKIEEIEFNESWRTGVKKVRQNVKTKKLLESGLARVKMSKKNKLRLDLFCVEMRILQLEIINLWMEND